MSTDQVFDECGVDRSCSLTVYIMYHIFDHGCALHVLLLWWIAQDTTESRVPRLNVHTNQILAHTFSLSTLDSVVS